MSEFSPRAARDGHPGPGHRPPGEVFTGPPEPPLPESLTWQTLRSSPPPGPFLLDDVAAPDGWAGHGMTPPPARSRILPWVVGAGAAAALIAIIGLGFFVGSAVSDTGRTGQMWSGDLEVGDCFLETDEDGTVVDVVPCAQPHQEETYAVSYLPEGEFPGDASVDAHSRTRCEAAFESYVGWPPYESSLDYHSQGPSRQSWEVDGDRKVVCSVYDPDAPTTTGSVRDGHP